MQLPNSDDKWIIDAICEGEFDYFIDTLVATAKARKGLVAPAPEPPTNVVTREQKVRMYSPGETVRFNSKIRPKYLAGLEATVVKCNRTTITVSCPNYAAYGRFQGKTQVRTPIEVVEYPS